MGGWIAEVHQPLGDVQRVHAGRAVELALRHELVHAGAVAVRDRVDVRAAAPGGSWR